jgi:hypothetical protein
LKKVKIGEGGVGVEGRRVTPDRTGYGHMDGSHLRPVSRNPADKTAQKFGQFALKQTILGCTALHVSQQSGLQQVYLWAVQGTFVQIALPAGSPRTRKIPCHEPAGAQVNSRFGFQSEEIAGL